VERRGKFSFAEPTLTNEGAACGGKTKNRLGNHALKGRKKKTSAIILRKSKLINLDKGRDS